MPRTRESVLADLAEYPERHYHPSIIELSSCCSVSAPDGGLATVDLGLLEAHSQLPGLPTNGGVVCDVSTGPCSCGAWH